jgi:hypothetical protein
MGDQPTNLTADRSLLDSKLLKELSLPAVPNIVCHYATVGHSGR